MTDGVLRVCESCPLPVRQEALSRGWRVIGPGSTEDEVSGCPVSQPASERRRKTRRGRIGVAENPPAGSRVFELYWRNSRFTKSEFKTGHDRAGRMNHFPHTKCLTKKDLLIHAMRKMRAVHGKIYDFLPMSFILPSEYTKFVHAYAAEDDDQVCASAKKSIEGHSGDKSAGRAVWICKPSDLSRGRKIFLIKDLSDLHYDQQYVVQRYVPNPLTIGGYKVDLRVYILVTSMQPLRVHIFRNGLARFGTVKYDDKMQDIDNLFSHLTNSSINKLSNTFDHDKEVIGSGSKWDFGALREWFKSNQLGEAAFATLWARICDISLCTILTALPSKPVSSSCFELFGFDILVDAALRPWLLEVNCAPALSIDGSTDRRVKEPLIRAVYDLVQQQQPVVKTNRRRGLRAIAPKNSKLRPASGKTRICPLPNAGLPPRPATAVAGQKQKGPCAGASAGAATTMTREGQQGASGDDSGTENFRAMAASTEAGQHDDNDYKDDDDDLSRFDCIFPFDETTAQAALLMATCQGQASQRKLAEAIRIIVQEIRKRRRGAMQAECAVSTEVTASR
ncbi:Tubulin polyglutamylase TTLL5 [Hondaea fermentalgiana]|uniref:Tubulin polyglutamylase TTLL5 n=1 Tax=Hondaea fermentalgiana TaxID=2315210 RepID=A0A2R5GLS3_9STRA|nr:Tubulin polyglutamylase TTLL5 [Hondaea fermentalgiana]|eukprot:GBG31827.1 Tubulin polyglutamylase TTLL5 [Hondaea fermentalgiana]